MQINFKRIFGRLKKKSTTTLKTISPKLKTKGKYLNKRHLAINNEPFNSAKVDFKTAIFIYKNLIKNQHTLYIIPKPIKIPNKGIIIRQEATGKLTGMNNQGLFSVQINGKKFFIKLCSPQSALRTYQATKLAQTNLNNYRQGKIGIKILLPHIMYANKNFEKGKGFLVSDYLESTNHIQLTEIIYKKRKTKKEKQITQEFKRANKFLTNQNVMEFEPYNLFYNTQTNELIAFDLDFIHIPNNLEQNISK